MHTVTNPCRHPCASFPRREVLDLRGSGPRESCCCFQPAAASHTTNIHAHAYIHTHSTLGPIIIAHHQSVCFLSFIRILPRCSHYPRISRHARRFSSFFVRVPTLFLAGPSFLLFALRCASRSFFLLAPRCAVRHTRPHAKTRSLSRAMPARKQKHARSALASAHTDDRRTDEATCGPQAWLTGRLH